MKLIEVVVEEEEGYPRLALLCNKPKANCGYRNWYYGFCEPFTRWGKLWTCFEKEPKKQRLRQ